MSLTSTQYAQLLAYINSDSQLSSIANTPDGSYDIADIMNTPSIPGYLPISVGSAMLWAAEGPRIRIEQASTNMEIPEVIRASCKIFLDLISGGTGSLLHTEDLNIKALFDAWVLAGIITQAEHDKVYLHPKGLACGFIAKSVELLNQTVTWQDVYQSRNM